MDCMEAQNAYSPLSVASWYKGVKATEPARSKFTELCRLFDALNELMENAKQLVKSLSNFNFFELLERYPESRDSPYGGD